MKVLLGTPAYGGLVTTRYHSSILTLAAELKKENVSFVHHILDSAVIATARNAMISALLENPGFTHLLFVDADMGFRPSLVRKMLAFDNPVVGVVAPRREQPGIGYVRSGRSGLDDEAALSGGTRFVGEHQDVLRGPANDPVMRDGFIRMLRIGAGIMLVSQAAAQKMVAGYPKLAAPAPASYQTKGVRTRVFQPFESMPDAAGIYVSEDYAFSERWTRLGGELWACADEPIHHVGRQEHVGTFAHKLQAIKQTH